MSRRADRATPSARTPGRPTLEQVAARTGAVALVIAESDDRVFVDAYFANIVRGISEVVAAAGRQLVVSLFRCDDRTALGSFLTPGHVDGVILLDQDATDWVLRTVLHKRLPVTTPALTTVRQPAEDVGRHLATRLLAQIDDSADPLEPPTVLPTSLVIREST